MRSSEGCSARQSMYSREHRRRSPSKSRRRRGVARPSSRRRPSSSWSRIASWSCSGMPSSMPIVRIGICAPRSAMKSKPPAPTSGSRRAGAELAHLRLDGVHLLGREHPRQQAAVDVVDRAGPRRGSMPGRDLDVGLDQLEDRALARPVRLPVDERPLDVVEAAQRVEVVLLVVVERRLVAQPLPDRVRIGVDLEVVRVVVEVAPAPQRHAATVLLVDATVRNAASKTTPTSGGKSHSGGYRSVSV